MITKKTVLVSIVVLFLIFTAGNKDVATSNEMITVDNNPRSNISDDPIDCEGPDIHCNYPTYLVTMVLPPNHKLQSLDFYLFTVTITDSSGVDCVQIIMKNNTAHGEFQWINYTMNHDITTDNPNRYSYTHSFLEDRWPVNFYFIANDTLGNYNSTRDYWVESTILVEIHPVEAVPYFFSTPMVVFVLVSGMIALIVLYLYRKGGYIQV